MMMIHQNSKKKKMNHNKMMSKSSYTPHPLVIINQRVFCSSCPPTRCVTSALSSPSATDAPDLKVLETSRRHRRPEPSKPRNSCMVVVGAARNKATPIHDMFVPATCKTQCSGSPPPDLALKRSPATVYTPPKSKDSHIFSSRKRPEAFHVTHIRVDGTAQSRAA